MAVMLERCSIACIISARQLYDCVKAEIYSCPIEARYAKKASSVYKRLTAKVENQEILVGKMRRVTFWYVNA